MNDSQEFFDKWLCPTYDDIVDKIKLEQGLYCEFEKNIEIYKIHCCIIIIKKNLFI